MLLYMYTCMRDRAGQKVRESMRESVLSFTLTLADWGTVDELSGTRELPPLPRA